jgi:hypothetical protein
MKRKLVCSVFSVLLIVSVANVHAQTPGQIPVFDQPGTGACNNAGGSDCVDSMITQDSSGNIGIGTTTPAAKLDLVGGSLNLENSTTTKGNILQGGMLFLHNLGAGNTFLGVNAGRSIGGGYSNTGTGQGSLAGNSTGYFNTASGVSALINNTTGFNNTASGVHALGSNDAGHDNTASGVYALYSNTSGFYDTANGVAALYNNTTGAPITPPSGIGRSSAETAPITPPSGTMRSPTTAPATTTPL